MLDADTFNRVVKIAVDAGEVSSVTAAYDLFRTYRVGVRVGQEIQHSAAHQAALLTVVNTARRALLGGVFVRGNIDVPLLVAVPGYATLGDAVRGLQGQVVAELPEGISSLVIGNVDQLPGEESIALRLVFKNWQGGVVPASCTPSQTSEDAIIPAAILAAGFAVSEVFQHLRGNPMAGRRRVGLSLWNPSESDWENATAGPTQLLLPKRLWLIGLGHLGQAYLWVLGLLPYKNPEHVNLVLQDFDRAAQSNDSTSLLTTPSIVGQMKTRAMADWAEARGFHVRLVERAFPGGIQVSDDEPKVALGGVDNPQARAAYEDAGFDWIVESGLGSGPTEYLALRLHTFPATSSARRKWGDEQTSNSRQQLELPAYQQLNDQGMDECGLVRLATRTVGAPFVGTVAASLVIAEVLRYLNGGPTLEVLDMTLRDPESRAVIESQVKKNRFNPGFTT